MNYVMYHKIPYIDTSFEALYTYIIQVFIDCLL